MAKAVVIARERIAAGDDTPVQRVELAAAAALRGAPDAALEWPEQAFEAGYRHYGFLERDPIFRPLGSRARCVSVLDRMRRDVEVQRGRARARGLLELRSLIGPSVSREPVNSRKLEAVIQPSVRQRPFVQERGSMKSAS